MERLLGRLLHREIERELDAPAFDRLNLAKVADLASHAVDHNFAGAVFPHQHRVVVLFDAGLADDGAE